MGGTVGLGSYSRGKVCIILTFIPQMKCPGKELRLHAGEGGSPRRFKEGNALVPL